MRLFYTPRLIQRLFPGYLWRVPAREPVLYLSFDDGPTPGVTEWVLETLDAHAAKATFFMVGRQAEAQPDLVQAVRDAGHSIGNHTYNHCDGWKTPAPAYLDSVLRTQRSLTEIAGPLPPLFRPPYGHITRAQARLLKPDYHIVMMDVMPYDFDPKLDASRCFQQLCRHVRPGSVICLHDSQKSWPRLIRLLPAMLGYFSRRQYRFEALSPALLQP